MDDKNNTGYQDRSRINVNEDYEVQYWTEKLGITKAELVQAVELVGTSAAAVEEYVNSYHKKK